MQTNEIQIRDPFILKNADKYYMYGSTDKDIWKGRGTGFDVYISHDLAQWEGPVFAFRPEEGFWGTHNFWAPEVFEHKGSFYMFASFAGELCKRGTAILKADRPEGPFMPWSNGAVTPHDWMCLDGTLFIDDENKPWIVFCHEWVQIKDGTVCAARLDDDLTRMVFEPAILFKSSEATWSGMAFSPSNNIEGHVTDGCFMYRLENGKLLLLWSCISENGYCLGYALSESGSINGPWKQSDSPLFGDDGGHGMIFRTYDGRLMLTLHRPNNTPDERAVFIEIEETGSGLKII